MRSSNPRSIAVSCILHCSSHLDFRDNSCATGYQVQKILHGAYGKIPYGWPAVRMRSRRNQIHLGSCTAAEFSFSSGTRWVPASAVSLSWSYRYMPHNFWGSYEGGTDLGDRLKTQTAESSFQEIQISSSSLPHQVLSHQIFAILVYHLILVSISWKSIPRCLYPTTIICWLGISRNLPISSKSPEMIQSQHVQIGLIPS